MKENTLVMMPASFLYLETFPVLLSLRHFLGQVCSLSLLKGSTGNKKEVRTGSLKAGLCEVVVYAGGGAPA